MNEILKLEVNALITRRILEYNSQLIAMGQIKQVEIPGPSVIHLSSHCNQPVHKQTDDHLISPVLRQGDPIQSNLNEPGHE